MKKFTFFILFIIILLTIYKHITKGISCDVFASPHEIISKTKLNNINYTLTKQTTGSHDRVFFLHLFDKPLSYDECGIISTSPIFSDMYNPDLKNNILVARDSFTISEEKIDGSKKTLQIEWSLEK